MFLIAESVYVQERFYAKFQIYGSERSDIIWGFLNTTGLNLCGFWHKLVVFYADIKLGAVFVPVCDEFAGTVVREGI